MDELQQSDMSRLTSDPTRPSTSPEGVPDAVAELRSRLMSESEKNQLKLVDELAQTGEPGVAALLDVLLERRAQPAGVVDGKIYQLLAASSAYQETLHSQFTQGLLPLPSERSIDYGPVQDLLVQQKFQDADQQTLQKLCELAGPTAVRRNWLYFTEVGQFPSTDLQTLNTLWYVYSEGRFGFSVQRDLWLGVGKNWDKLWPKIGWKAGNSWTRYPQEFTWDRAAPVGHLPLSNQLRGVRVMEALLNHPAWTSKAIAP